MIAAPRPKGPEFRGDDTCGECAKVVEPMSTYLHSPSPHQGHKICTVLHSTDPTPSVQPVGGRQRTRKVNFEDPNLNIKVPVFSISGNHDDPSGEEFTASAYTSQCFT
jgi:hypothetical protein